MKNKRIVEIFCMFWFVIICPLNLFAKTVYIDPSSTKKKELGTIEFPFKSWSSVTWESGNKYLQKRGTIFYGTIKIGASGTPDHPIELGAYGKGPNPIIYGGRTLTGSWKYEGNGVWSKAIPAGTGHAFFVSGKLLLQATTKECIDGKWYRAPGPKIYFRPNYGSPADWKIEYGFYQTAISAVDQSYITIKDFDITKFDCSEDGYAAIYFKGERKKIKGINIIKCNIYNCENKGIAIDNALEPKVAFCKLFNLGRCGIYFRQGTSNGRICYNIIYSIGKLARSKGGDVGGIFIGSSGNCKGNIVEYNEVYDVGNSSINNKLDCVIASWGESRQTETIYRYNYIHDNDACAINTGNHGGGSQVYHNLILRNGGTNPKNKNGGIYISNASLDPDEVVIYNNTCVYNTAPLQQGGIWAYDAPSKIKMFNNIVAFTNGPTLVIPPKILSFSAYKNCYFTSNHQVPFIIYKNMEFKKDNFFEYVKLIRSERDSLVINPSFSEETYFSLKDDSQCKGSGIKKEYLEKTFKLQEIINNYNTYLTAPKNLRIEN